MTESDNDSDAEFLDFALFPVSVEGDSPPDWVPDGSRMERFKWIQRSLLGDDREQEDDLLGEFGDGSCSLSPLQVLLLLLPLFFYPCSRFISGTYCNDFFFFLTWEGRDCMASLRLLSSDLHLCCWYVVEFHFLCVLGFLIVFLLPVVVPVNLKVNSFANFSSVVVACCFL